MRKPTEAILHARIGRSEKREERHIQRATRRSERRATQLSTKLVTIGSTDPMTLMRNMKIEFAASQYTIGPGTIQSLKDVGITSAADLWDDGVPYAPRLPGIGDKRQYVLESWASQCWQTCESRAQSNKDARAAVRRELNDLPRLLDFEIRHIRSEAQERRDRLRGKG